jgi:hypothetical protein
MVTRAKRRTRALGVGIAAVLACGATSAWLTPAASGKPVPVSAASTTVKATFTSGSGANRFEVRVSTHGNLTSFVSPAGQEHVFGNDEGYALCNSSGSSGVVHGHDTGDVEAGFGNPTFSQPTAGKFPLTVTRTTTNGKFRLRQVWTVDGPGQVAIVTQTVTNISTASINDVRLVRSGDFDVLPSSNDLGAQTAESAWQWNDENDAELPPHGIMLSVGTRGQLHDAYVGPLADWAASRASCRIPGIVTPTAPTDLASVVAYFLGNLTAGQSKTVVVRYTRL